MEEADSHASWQALDVLSSPPDCSSLKVTAARECFEETQFLPLPLQPGAQLPTGTAPQSDFLSMVTGLVKQQVLKPTCLAALTPVARFITPRSEKTRFDTTFFVHVLDFDQTRAAVVHDRGETVAADWFLAADVLRDHRRFLLMPPQWFLLHQLQHLMKETKNQWGWPLPQKWPLPAVEPKLEHCPGERPVLVLPGDELHADYPGVQGAHHRIHLDGFRDRLLDPHVSYRLECAVPGVVTGGTLATMAIPAQPNSGQAAIQFNCLLGL